MIESRVVGIYIPKKLNDEFQKAKKNGYTITLSINDYINKSKIVNDYLNDKIETNDFLFFVNQFKVFYKIHPDNFVKKFVVVSSENLEKIASISKLMKYSSTFSAIVYTEYDINKGE